MIHGKPVAFALRPTEGRTTVGEIGRKIGVAKATFYRCKRIYAGMERPSDNTNIEPFNSRVRQRQQINAWRTDTTTTGRIRSSKN
jgi:hypothetical protein